jgi:hypothetical protein
MLTDKISGVEETKPESADLTGVVRIDLIKLLEQLR